MVHGFYFRFYQLTHCQLLSVLLSHLTYMLCCIKFLIKRFTITQRAVKVTNEVALEYIQNLHKKTYCDIKYEMSEEDNSVDLSIIVPVYNYVDLIENNIISILNQKTEYKYELILVDDGSTDGAQEILRKYINYSNVKVIFQQNQGIAGARNTGLSNAVGRYIMFVDCDDIVENNIVDVLMRRAYKDDCDIVMCAHNLVKQKDSVTYQTLANIYPNSNLQRFDKRAEILNYAGLPWCKVYKRKLWEQVRFFPGLWFEDTIIHSLLFTQCEKFAYEPIVCYQYRWYENNFSHTQGKNKNIKNIDVYWLMTEILSQYEVLNLPKNEKYETMLLKHLSAYYYPKIIEMGDETVDMLFALACNLYDKYGVKENCKLPYMLRVTKKALQQGDINLWKIASKYQR